MGYTTTLFRLEDIAILLQYLYMDELNSVTVDNGVTKLEIRMDEECKFHAKNLSFPDLPELCYSSSMTVSNMLGIIAQLEKEPPHDFKQFSSRWEEIKTEALATVAMNKMNQKRHGTYPQKRIA